MLWPTFFVILSTPYSSNLIGLCQDHHLCLLMTPNLWQRQVNKVLVWLSVIVGYRSIIHIMPLSGDKSLVLNCGSNNPKRQCVIGNQPLPTALQLNDLDVLRSQAISMLRIQQIFQRIAVVCRVLFVVLFDFEIFHCFGQRFKCILCPRLYMQRHLGSPILKCDITAVGSVQRH